MHDSQAIAGFARSQKHGLNLLPGFIELGIASDQSGRNSLFGPGVT